LGVASAIALAAAIGVVTSQPASAFTCAGSNPAATGNDSAQSDNTACGQGAIAGDSPTNTVGDKATAYGWNAVAKASDSVAIGAAANVDDTSDMGTAVGRNATVGPGAPGGTAIGRNARALDDYAVAVGESSTASGSRSIAIGKSAQATGNFSTAIGNSANTNGFSSSTALGVGAQATANNEMVFGRPSETYTAPGITSGLSSARQSGPLEVVTSDANGHLASDGGAIFSQLNQLQNNDTKIFSQLDQLHSDINTVESGVAVALSAVGPDLVGAERFGLSLNWGGFEGASAIGGGATAVVSRWNGSRLAVTGGIGVGLDDNAVGGRAGGQWTW
jgi:hypothetical protein